MYYVLCVVYYVKSYYDTFDYIIMLLHYTNIIADHALYYISYHIIVM